MKLILLLSLFFSFAGMNAQQEDAQVIIPITVRVNNPVFPPGMFDSLKIGLDPTATDSLDEHLGEYPIPPIPPPGFPCKLFIPYGNFNTISVWRDFRFAELPFSGTKEYRIRFDASEGATISWIFPEGVTGIISDLITGTIINVAISDSGSYFVSLPINDLRLLITFNNVTPVEISTFKAHQSGNSTILNWLTSSETNNIGFEIERLKDFKIRKSDEWEKIGFVEGHGTTTVTHSYSFIDKDFLSGKIKYRLKQIDFDGTYEYSNEIEVNTVITPKEFVLHQNYPNPFNSSTIIKYQVPEEGRVTINLYNILGERIKTLFEGEKSAGAYTINFSSDALPSGNYFYSLESGTFRQVKKMTILK